MIGKVIPSRAKVPFRSFKNLNDYITAKRKGDDTRAKVAYAGCFNLDHVDDATEVMNGLAKQRDSRCKNPLFHCLLSWKEGEIPTKEQAHQAAWIALKELNLQDCHAIYGVHKDTQNYHLQMSVCRIHPFTGKTIDAGGGFTQKAMERAARRVEYMQGWSLENNSWSNINANGEIIDNERVTTNSMPQKARDMENLTGEKSAIRRASELLKDKLLFETISNWQEFHKAMADNGMEYLKKGSGAVVKVGEEFVKASSITKNISLTKLERRFGEYQEQEASQAVNEEIKSHLGIPVPIAKVNSTADWRTYIDKRKSYYGNKKRNRQEMSEHHKEQKRNMKERQRNERSELFVKMSGQPRIEILAERSILAMKHKQESLALRDVQKEERGEYNNLNPSFPTYKAWLLLQDRIFEAEDYRHRRDKEPTTRNEIYGLRELYGSAKYTDIRGFAFIRSKNGILFVNKESPSVVSFIDRGNKLRMLQNDDSSVLAALQLGQQKWGMIRVDGTDEYKKRCAELAVENRIKIANPELQPYIRTLQEAKNKAQREVHKMSGELEDFKKYHGAMGADRYKVTATEIFPNGDKRGFMVNNRDGAPDGWTAEELEKKMPRLVSLKASGRNIYYTPISEKKHHILIDDLNNESLAKVIVDGYRPSAIIQSSPGNWQAVITIPKLGTEMDREIGNALVAALNQQYGDKNVSGEIHAHRAPGFDNLKPKYQEYKEKFGYYPKVELSRTEKVYCGKTIQMAKEIRQQILTQREKDARGMESMLSRLEQSGRSVTDTNRAYLLHFKDIIRLQERQGHDKAGIDASRMDAMIGIRLRATGHSREQIQAAIEVMAPEIRKSLGSLGTHPWEEYSKRTVDYLFSYRGDTVLKGKQRWFQDWTNIERGANNVKGGAGNKQQRPPEQKQENIQDRSMGM
jgi:hypothetical protein